MVVALATPPRRRPAENHDICFDTNASGVIEASTEGTKLPSIEIADTLEVALSKDFASVPQVRHILTEQGNGPLLVWISVDNPEPSVRERIYQKELELITGFPEVDFDFNLVPSLGREPFEIASNAAVTYTRAL